MSLTGLRNIGPKSAAWLRQVGVHGAADLAALGPVQAFLRVRRAGFRPSLNLLYALEGALARCHWHDVPEARRRQLLDELETASAALPPPRGTPMTTPVTTSYPGGGEDGGVPVSGDDADAED